MTRSIAIVKETEVKKITSLMKALGFMLLLMGYTGAFNNVSQAQVVKHKNISLLKGNYNWQKKEIIEFKLIKNIALDKNSKLSIDLAEETNLGQRATRRLIKLKYISFIVNFRKENFFA